MDFTTNINDPAGIQAILDALKSSQAWKDATQAPQPAPASCSSSAISPSTQSGSLQEVPSTSHTSSDNKRNQRSSSPPTSVAALLSQLQTTPTSSSLEPYTSVLQPKTQHLSTSHEIIPFQVSDPVINRAHPPPLPVSVQTQDLRSCTFQQALPHLARLSEDAKFVTGITAMKKEQAEFEKKLWQERRAIQQSHEEKVKVARTKAKMIGADLTQYEADALTESFRRDLQKFDAERVLPAWDGLIAKQQAALELLGVPSMFPISTPSEREKQQRIVQVLIGVAED